MNLNSGDEIDEEEEGSLSVPTLAKFDATINKRLINISQSMLQGPEVMVADGTQIETCLQLVLKIHMMNSFIHGLPDINLSPIQLHLLLKQLIDNYHSFA
jgi:hypothetical protein